MKKIILSLVGVVGLTAGGFAQDDPWVGPLVTNITLSSMPDSKFDISYSQWNRGFDTVHMRSTNKVSWRYLESFVYKMDSTTGKPLHREF